MNSQMLRLKETQREAVTYIQRVKLLGWGPQLQSSQIALTFSHDFPVTLPLPMLWPLSKTLHPIFQCTELL